MGGGRSNLENHLSTIKTSRTPVMAIVGGAVGCGIVLCVVAVVVLVLKNRRQSQQNAAAPLIEVRELELMPSGGDGKKSTNIVTELC